MGLIKRTLLFLLICIPLRFCAVLLAKYGSLKLLQILGLIYLLFGLGIFIIYYLGIRGNGQQTSLGNKVWWGNIRPIFGVLWILFGLLAINKKKEIAWRVLFIEVIFGLYMFLLEHNSFIH